jgi:transcription elongation factor Elf1
MKSKLKCPECGGEEFIIWTLTGSLDKTTQTVRRVCKCVHCGATAEPGGEYWKIVNNGTMNLTLGGVKE